MSKIKRYNDNVKSFAKDALGTKRTIFNSLSQSDTLDDNVSSDYFRGTGIYELEDHVFLQDFNAFHFSMNELVSHLYQVGLPIYALSQEYHTGSLVQFEGDIYKSNVDDNIGNSPGGGGTQDYNLVANVTTNLEPATFLISLGNNFYVHDEDNGDFLVLKEYNPTTKSFNEISRQDVSVDGRNAENLSNSSLSQGCRLSDNFFAISGKGPGFSSRDLFAYHIDTNTGVFILKDILTITGGVGAGSPFNLDEMINVPAATVLKFIASSSSVDPRLFEFDTVGETITLIDWITTSGDAGDINSYMGAAILNYSEDKLVVAFEDGGPVAPFSGGIGLYQLVGTVLTNIAGSWDNTLHSTSTGYRVKRFSDDKIMSIQSSSSIQSIFTDTLNMDGLTFTNETSTTIGPRSTDQVLALVTVNDDKSFMISHRYDKELQVYENSFIEGAWSILSSEDLDFNTSGTSLTSNNTQDAIIEMLVDMRYPVGSFYKNINNVDPSITLGFGTWERVQGRFLIGLDDGDIDIDGPLETGGNRVLTVQGHTLIVDELPPHTHTVGNDPGSTDEPGNYLRSESQETTKANTHATGGGLQHVHAITGDVDNETLPPFFAMYIYRRVS
jgi:hypothetical protein